MSYNEAITKVGETDQKKDETIEEEEFNEEDDLQVDEELDEYLCNYYNSLRVYDIMKTLKDMVSRIGEVPLYDNLTHSDVYELLYPTYDNQGYMF